ncbi:MAG: hypothetical protein HWE22_11555 [Flavobacteriales bacterium]|nr:hypothetical protein [Flavobacteriales bacterium]PIE86601.1 MAG: hypothetical protein CSA03_04475 [Bacteroidota bacterium]
MTEFVEHEEQKTRPALLLVLAILSFISIGVGILSNTFGLISGPLSEEDIKVQRVEMAKQKSQLRGQGMSGMVSFVEKLEGMIEETNNNFYLSKGILFLTDFIGLFGVIFMLRRRKLGFHMYIVYSLLALGGMYLYVSPENIHMSLPIFNLIISGLFIFLYSRTLHWMRN